MVDVVALSPPRRRIQAYRAKRACFNMSETYDRLGLKHLQVPCIPTNTGGGSETILGIVHDNIVEDR